MLQMTTQDSPNIKLTYPSCTLTYLIYNVNNFFSLAIVQSGINDNFFSQIIIQNINHVIFVITLELDYFF